MEPQEQAGALLENAAGYITTRTIKIVSIMAFSS